MSLRHALLTSLLEKPCTGAELARRFDKSIGYFWQATHQQIYRELAALERDSLIEAKEFATSRGTGRQFLVLPEGAAELRRWIVLEAEPRPIRDEFFVRLRTAAALGDVSIWPEVQRQRALHEEMLERYKAIERHDFPADANPERTEAEQLQRAVLRAGIHFEQSWLSWCEETLECQESGSSTMPKR